MSAGRELDSFIAEKVMGWKRHQIEGFTEMGLTLGDKQKYPFIGEAVFNPADPHEKLPHYTSNISDAWKIFDHIIDASLGECNGSVQRSETSVTTGYRCWFSDEDGTYESDWVNNPALAICLAALKKESSYENR